MNFSRIKETIENRNFVFKKFVKEHTGMTADGFRLALENKTLKVETLEKITEALGLQMSYWWTEPEFENSSLKFTPTKEQLSDLVAIWKIIVINHQTVLEHGKTIAEIAKLFKDIEAKLSK